MSNPSERLLEIGKLYCDRGDYGLALPNLQEAAANFLTEKNIDAYLRTIKLILRIHAEREEHEDINRIKESLHDLVLREGIDLNAKTYYTLGTCALYKSQPESAEAYFKKSLEICLKEDNKEDICHAVLGLSIAYRMQQKYEMALKEIYNLNIFLQVLDIPELRIASANSNARILMDLKKYEQALDVLWGAYEEIKNIKDLRISIYLMANIGITLFELGQKDAAKIYLNLAAKTIDPSSNRFLLSNVEKYMAQLENSGGSDCDLVFDLENHAIIERSLGKIDFKNQFILLDLLKLFISNKGQIFSKEYLVEHVWKQDYNPEVHDNKIYVTIKRLRKMIEPDYDKPKYIFRAKNGYYLNKTAKVELSESRAEGAL